MRAQIERVSTQRDADLEGLERALERLEQDVPTLIHDADCRAALEDGWLEVAREKLQHGASEQAKEIVKQLIRAALERDLDVERFGPSMERLYAECKLELANGGIASVPIECSAACKVAIDREPTLPGRHGLYPGQHHVRIWSPSDPAAVSEWQVVIDDDLKADPETIEWPEPAPQAEPPPPSVPDRVHVDTCETCPICEAPAPSPDPMCPRADSTGEDPRAAKLRGLGGALVGLGTVSGFGLGASLGAWSVTYYIKESEWPSNQTIRDIHNITGPTSVALMCVTGVLLSTGIGLFIRAKQRSSQRGYAWHH